MPDESLLRLFLSIVSFAIAVGGLAQTIYIEYRQTTNVRILAIILTVIVALTAVTAYNRYDHWVNVQEVARNTISILRIHKNLTADQIYGLIWPPVEYSILVEALERLVKYGAVRYRIEEFNLLDGVVAVRIFSLT